MSVDSRLASHLANMTMVTLYQKVYFHKDEDNDYIKSESADVHNNTFS